MNLLELIKSGGLKPNEATLSGTLTPKQGKLFAKSIIAANALLGKVTTDITGKLTKERSGWDAAKGMLTRHKSGDKAPKDNFKKLGKIGCKLDMTRGVELNAQINDDTLEDNQDDPNFEKEQFASFNTVFGNDLLYLGIVGTDDSDDHTASFDELAKGWFTVAKESDDTNKLTTSDGSILHRLKYLVKNANKDARSMSTILMSDDDYTEYQFEISEKYKDLATLLKADRSTFMQIPIEVSADITNGEYLMTPLKNMIFGISSRVKRDRWFSNEESCLKYKFVVYPDYEFDIHKYVTIMTYVEVVKPELTVTSYEVPTKVGSTNTRKVTSAADGVENVTVESDDDLVVAVAYDTATGQITFTAIAEGTATVTVDDGTSTKEITVTVSAA
jgi:hypothetical protein